jgi:mxaJ protein
MPASPIARTLAGLALSLAGMTTAAAQSDSSLLRVCADPNNLPFSDAEGGGFENRIAELVGKEIGKTVAYTWWAQRRGFVRNTLKERQCDLVIGVPAHYDPVDTTRPYYRSTYVFVSRADRNYRLTSLKDPRLRSLKIGVHLIGDDGTNTPPAHALGEQGIIDNVTGFPIYGDYREKSPPTRLIEAVEKGDLDIAAAWGPLAGYAALHSPVPLRIDAIEDGAAFAPLSFEFDIAMGVRRGDSALKAAVDSLIDRKHADIEAVLREFGIPLVSKQQSSAK